MNVDDILAEWEVDSPIDETRLIEASLSAGKLHHKYMQMYVKEKMTLLTMKAKLKAFIRLKTEYYLGNLDQETLKEHNWVQWAERIPRSELSTWVDGDKQVIQANLNVAKQQEVVDLLNEILKVIANRSYHINNAISYKKFLAGGQ